MAGKNKGVLARILSLFPLALYYYCMAHNNLKNYQSQKMGFFYKSNQENQNIRLTLIKIDSNW